MNTRQRGFTLIEILVAITLLGILTTILIATLTGSLSLNRHSQQQLKSSTNAQRLIESVRGAWSNKDQYARACAPDLVVPPGYEVQFVNLDSRAQPINLDGSQVAGGTPTSYPLETDCTAQTGDLVGSPAAPPPMRQVIVRTGSLDSNGAVTTGKNDVELKVAVLEPL